MLKSIKLNRMAVGPKLNENIPVLTQDQYWGEVSKDEMEKILALIEKKGFEWFKKELFNQDRKFYDFIFSPVRADWRFCLPVEKDWRVLDLGAGLGANTFTIAKEIAEVTAVERSYLRAKFLELRKRAENQNNVEIMAADVLNLPFGDNSFDLIIANGLFEWLGATEKFSSPQKAQEHFLREVRRILKPGGWLYIGIENRFAATYLFGGLDHSGLRYTSWLPRPLANFYTKARTGKKYQTYTYSKAGYEKMLRRADFQNIETYLVLPGYNVPKYIVRHNHLSGLKFLTGQVLGGLNFKKRILKKIINWPLVARLWRFLYFSFAIFGQK